MGWTERSAFFVFRRPGSGVFEREWGAWTRATAGAMPGWTGSGLIAPTLEAMGYDLRVLVSGRHNPLLRVMAERKDGRAMHVDHCVEVSHAVGPA